VQTLNVPRLLPHERRVCRVLESRGQGGLGEALVRLDGTPLGRRHRIDSLYAVGGEGVVYLASDLFDPAKRLVAKIPLVPFHRPLDLSSNFLRRRREQLREEARNLDSTSSRFLPTYHGLYEIRNPLIDAARGGEFGAPEPVLVMEWMPGFDLDLWLARVHRSEVPVQLLRRNLDRVAVVLLHALVELEEQGFYYADLRPGNLRMMGRPERRIRLLDAGSLVERGDESGRFPHVPSYLPPELFRRKHQTGETILPSAAAQAVMAGRTLFEVATGNIPFPGQEIDRAALKDSHVSAPVADVVDGLATGSFGDVRPALRYLERRAVKRVPIPLAPHATVASPESLTPRAASPARPAESRQPAAATGSSPAVPPAAAPAPPPRVRPALAEQGEILPPSRPRRWWHRLLGQ
jgi:serine/threonine protein kinase